MIYNPSVPKKMVGISQEKFLLQYNSSYMHICFSVSVGRLKKSFKKYQMTMSVFSLKGFFDESNGFIFSLLFIFSATSLMLINLICIN